MEGVQDVQEAGIGLMNAFAGASWPELKGEMELIAAREMPKEACGLLVSRDGKVSIHHSENKASDKLNFFRIEDYDDAEAEGDVIAIWHSHPHRMPRPSMADKTLAESCKLPMLIVGIPTRQWQVYEPSGWRAPLIGRHFAWGVLDCWALARDYYAEKLSIDLPDFERDDKTKTAGYEKVIARMPFEKIEVEAGIELHDLILMDLRTPHVGIYIGDGMMLHHLEGKISTMHPYLSNNGFYAKNTIGIWRHATLLHKS